MASVHSWGWRKVAFRQGRSRGHLAGHYVQHADVVGESVPGFRRTGVGDLTARPQRWHTSTTTRHGGTSGTARLARARNRRAVTIGGPVGGRAGWDVPMAEKQPNEKLTTWFARSGWSKGELARQVNRRARQIGAHHVSTDTSRVRRWLDGEQPREPIPKIMSELFSERFGSVVSIEDLGLRAAIPVSTVGGGVDLPWSGPQTVQLISDYSRSDLMLNRRGFLGTSLALTAGAALIEPMQRWLAPARPASPPRSSPRPTAARRSPAGSPSPSWNCWSRPRSCSASGTRRTAAGCAARPSSANCTRSPTCSRRRTARTPPGGCSGSPPNSPTWPGGCPTTSGCTRARRSTTCWPCTRPRRPATARSAR